MKASRLAKNLEICSFKIQRIKEISEAINDNLETDKLLDLFKVFLNEKLEIGQFVFYSCASKEWELLSDFGVEGIPDLKNFNEYNKDIDIQIGDFQVPGVKPTFEVLIPVYHHQKLLSLLFLADPEEKIGISPIIKHLTFIQSLTNLVSVAIVNKRLHLEEIEKERLNRELELAAEMQSTLIPEGSFSNKYLKLDAYYQPHNLIGGDYYDYFIDESRIVFCMADVSGKGISAAIFMSNFQAKLHSLLKNTDLRLAELVRILHEEIDVVSKGDRFITLFIAEYNYDTHLLEYVNAGHNPPMCLHNNEIKLLERGTTGLGMVEELPQVKVGSQVVRKDDVIICYTDGITETQSENGDWFGEERLMDILKKSGMCGTPNKINAEIIDKTKSFQGKMADHDDFALLTICFN
jgi:sigma-B regulation protein RsbU (phosphoserine phosphatase)